MMNIKGWLQGLRDEPESAPLLGVRIGGRKIDAPPADAPSEQLFDFGSLLGCAAAPGPWSKRIAEAYLEKWG